MKQMMRTKITSTNNITSCCGRCTQTRHTHSDGRSQRQTRKKNEGYESIIGKYGLGMRNENGERLVDFCGMNNLVVTGTIFPHRLINKKTWISPGGTAKNQIDHVCVSRQHRSSVMDTRAMRGAGIASDHQLVRTKIKLKVKRKQKTKVSRRKFDTGKLQQSAIKTQFTLKLKNRYDVLHDYDEVEAVVKRKWQDFEDAYKEAAKMYGDTEKRS